MESPYFDNPGDRDPSQRHRRAARSAGDVTPVDRPRIRDERCPFQVYAAPAATGGWSRARIRPLTCR